MFFLSNIKFNLQKGFTLIELLIVVAIIGMLSSIVVSNVSAARLKVRDTQRLSDLHQMRNALELYASDHNGNYPVVVRWAISEVNVNTYNTTLWPILQTTLSPYISKLPSDPAGTGSTGPWSNGNYHYAYSSDGTTYDLIGQLEDPNNQNICSVKKWRYHQGEGAIIPDGFWCGGPNPPNGNYSNYLVADH